jgi:CubicO group peptidase (beta-lactamase class C family)
MDTLLYYFYRYQHSHNVKGSRTKKWDWYEVKPSGNFFQFKSNLKEDKYIKKQMSKTAMLSYILYEDGKITIDEISPKDRFGNFVNNETKLRSMSVGKTMVSYVMGHAICKGYIDSIDSTLNDWDLANNTLYKNQKIIDLLNMTAGDQKYVYGSDFKDGDDTDTITAKEAMKKMSNKKRSKSKYNYNGLLPHLLMNYILFKSGDDFENLLEDIFQNEAKIKHSVYFFKHPKTHKDEGNANSMFFATRYDYLRIAKNMLDDWQNDTCFGKYLKTIHERRIPKNDKWKNTKSSFFNPTAYAGFFHTNYSGMKKRAVLGMDGLGGQQIIIDFDRSRIVVINSIHQNYNWKKIAHSVIKKGE